MSNLCGNPWGAKRNNGCMIGIHRNAGLKKRDFNIPRNLGVLKVLFQIRPSII
jgi:hypothetical protein